MPTLGRNEPCHCGSGKKYKKCCLAKDEDAARGRRAVVTVPTGVSADTRVIVDDDELDMLSNRVVDLIDEQKFDEAERARDQLREKYPDEIDAIERTAMIEQARGNLTAAIEWWNKTLDYMARNDGFEEEGLQRVRDVISNLQREVAARGAPVM